MAFLQAAVLALIALIVAPGLFFYFDVTPKIVVLLLGTAAVLVWPRRSDASAPRAFSLLAAASLLSLAVATALSSNPALSLFGTNWRRFGALEQAAVLLFAWRLAETLAGKPERARTILRGVALTGGVTALYGIAQYFGWDPLLPKAAYHIGEGIWTIVRPPGTLGYVSYFATWLLGVAFLSMALADAETSVWARRACYGNALLAAAAMLLTGTRAALLALAAGWLVWLFGQGFRIPKRAWIAAAALAVVAIGFYFSPAGWLLRSRTRWFVEDPWGGGRIHLWRDSAEMGLRRPLGYGPEVFTAAFPRFESRELARAHPDFLFESPHNIFLDTWVSQGIAGVAILAGFCWIGLAAAWRRKQIWLAAALAASIVSQLFTVFTMPTALLFYAMVALAVSAQGPVSRSWSIPAALRWALALGLVWPAVRFAVSDRHLELAQEALRRGDVAAATLDYSAYDKSRLPGTGSDLWYSRACADLAGKASNPLAGLQARAQFGAAAQRATQTAEEPFNAWYNFSAWYAQSNDFANTERCLRSAIAARPNWFKPHWTLAQVLRLEGRLDEAEREAAIAADRDGGKDPEVLQTLNQIRAQRGAAHPQP